MLVLVVWLVDILWSNVWIDLLLLGLWYMSLVDLGFVWLECLCVYFVWIVCLLIWDDVLWLFVFVFGTWLFGLVVGCCFVGWFIIVLLFFVCLYVLFVVWLWLNLRCSCLVFTCLFVADLLLVCYVGFECGLCLGLVTNACGFGYFVWLF